MDGSAPGKSDLLLYVGTGLLVGSAILGLAVGLIYLLRSGTKDFRYGVFYSTFALVASIGYCLGAIAFFFQFLHRDIAIFCSLVAAGALIGLVLIGIFLKKSSRVLFGVLSFYLLLVVWLAPVFLWNMLYLFWVSRNSKRAELSPVPSSDD
jgi:hypothetical protein